MLVRPMLAGKYDPAKQKFPCIYSRKVDGFRILIRDGVALTRSMKPLPNEAVQDWARKHKEELEGLDGEMTVGAPNDPETFDRTTSALRRRDGSPDFFYFVFDRHDKPGAPFSERVAIARQAHGLGDGRVIFLDHRVAFAVDDLAEAAIRSAQAGFEGLMVRSCDGLYKQGRATTSEGSLLKIKTYERMEAVIIAVAEEMFNGNEATVSEIGLTKRSTHKVNLVGKGTAGSLSAKGLNGPFKDVEFDVGSGMSDDVKADIWARREEVIGDIICVEYVPVGSKDKPRHPTYKGFRPAFDMDPPTPLDVLERT